MENKLLNFDFISISNKCLLDIILENVVQEQY
jgi:hypothetical protein